VLRFEACAAFGPQRLVILRSLRFIFLFIQNQSVPSMPIYRFIQHCKPAPTSRTYHPWQTADIVLLISAPSREEALQRRLQVLQQQRWEILRTREKSTLIEERVREAGGAVWEAYKTCGQRGYWIQVFPDHFAAGRSGAGIGPKSDKPSEGALGKGSSIRNSTYCISSMDKSEFILR
jgi:hypothetical protein